MTRWPMENGAMPPAWIITFSGDCQMR